MSTSTRRRVSSARPDDTPSNPGLWLTIIILSAYGVAISVALGCRVADLPSTVTFQVTTFTFFGSAAFGFAIRKFFKD